MLQIDDVFGPDGALKRALPDFIARRQQVHMAERVAAALQHREALVVEAGTGTGKTFAYLVPALLSGARVIISTGTRTLQDQLFNKDVPLVAGAIGRPARIALLKGRANYLCLHRLARASQELGLLPAAPRERQLPLIERWARTTRTGDLAEVPGLSDTDALWPRITSTRDNCLGVRCEEFARCHVVAARREAQESDIVIVNHHLLLADLALKEGGFGDILGSADAIILDEAHQLPDLAAQFFGANVGSRGIETLIATLRQERERTEAVANALTAVEGALAELAAALPRRPGRVAWDESPRPLDEPTHELADRLESLATALGAREPEEPVGGLAERANELAVQLQRIAGTTALEGARSFECSDRSFVLHLLPFDVAERFQGLVTGRRCAWIFTSATLSVGEDFAHFTARLGLGDAPTLRIESPFDYERQSLLYLPPDLPEPASPAHAAAVLETALPLLEASRGGAFLLFTSHRALAQAAAQLRERWGREPPYRLLVQGEAPRERLLADFRADGNAVLLGTASFWEGVDVKGGALRLVIIDKLPFGSPEDPLVKARIEHIEARGGNPFREFQLPEAALALKQGVGRLIRSEEDYGAVVICDRRLSERSYGRALLSVLPPMTRTRDADETAQFLRRHR